MHRSVRENIAIAGTKVQVAWLPVSSLLAGIGEMAAHTDLARAVKSLKATALDFETELSNLLAADVKWLKEQRNSAPDLFALLQGNREKIQAHRDLESRGLASRPGQDQLDTSEQQCDIDGDNSEEPSNELMNKENLETIPNKPSKQQNLQHRLLTVHEESCQPQMPVESDGESGTFSRHVNDATTEKSEKLPCAVQLEAGTVSKIDDGTRRSRRTRSQKNNAVQADRHTSDGMKRVPTDNNTGTANQSGVKVEDETRSGSCSSRSSDVETRIPRSREVTKTIKPSQTAAADSGSLLDSASQSDRLESGVRADDGYHEDRKAPLNRLREQNIASSTDDQPESSTISRAELIESPPRRVTRSQQAKNSSNALQTRSTTAKKEDSVATAPQIKPLTRATRARARKTKKTGQHENKSIRRGGHVGETDLSAKYYENIKTTVQIKGDSANDCDPTNTAGNNPGSPCGHVHGATEMNEQMFEGMKDPDKSQSSRGTRSPSVSQDDHERYDFADNPGKTNRKKSTGFADDTSKRTDIVNELVKDESDGEDAAYQPAGHPSHVALCEELEQDGTNGFSRPDDDFPSVRHAPPFGSTKKVAERPEQENESSRNVLPRSFDDRSNREQRENRLDMCPTGAITFTGQREGCQSDAEMSDVHSSASPTSAKEHRLRAAPSQQQPNSSIRRSPEKKTQLHFKQQQSSTDTARGNQGTFHDEPGAYNRCCTGHESKGLRSIRGRNGASDDSTDAAEKPSETHFETPRDVLDIGKPQHEMQPSAAESPAQDNDRENESWNESEGGMRSMDADSAAASAHDGKRSDVSSRLRRSPRALNRPPKAPSQSNQTEHTDQTGSSGEKSSVRFKVNTRGKVSTLEGGGLLSECNTPVLSAARAEATNANGNAGSQTTTHPNRLFAAKESIYQPSTTVTRQARLLVSSNQRPLPRNNSILQTQTPQQAVSSLAWRSDSKITDSGEKACNSDAQYAEKTEHEPKNPLENPHMPQQPDSMTGPTDQDDLAIPHDRLSWRDNTATFSDGSLTYFSFDTCGREASTGSFLGGSVSQSERGVDSLPLAMSSTDAYKSVPVKSEKRPRIGFFEPTELAEVNTSRDRLGGRDGGKEPRTAPLKNIRRPRIQLTKSALRSRIEGLQINAGTPESNAPAALVNSPTPKSASEQEKTEEKQVLHAPDASAAAERACTETKWISSSGANGEGDHAETGPSVHDRNEAVSQEDKTETLNDVDRKKGDGIEANEKAEEKAKQTTSSQLGNIMTSITSFLPSFRPRKEETGAKKDEETASSAAENARLDAERREAELNLRREAMRVAKQREAEEKQKRIEAKRQMIAEAERAKEEERKRKEAERMRKLREAEEARKRQREEEEKKREQKRRRVEEQQRRLAQKEEEKRRMLEEKDRAHRERMQRGKGAGGTNVGNGAVGLSTPVASSSNCHSNIRIGVDGLLQVQQTKKAAATCKHEAPCESYEMSAGKNCGDTDDDNDDNDGDDDDDNDSCDSANERRRHNRKRKRIPLWARSANLPQSLVAQTRDPDTIFERVHTLNLDEVFEGHRGKKKFRARTSSGMWVRDRLTAQEELDYKKATIGFDASGSERQS